MKSDRQHIRKKVPAKYGEAKIEQESKKMDKTKKEAAWRVNTLFLKKNIHMFLVYKYVQLTTAIQL